MVCTENPCIPVVKHLLPHQHLPLFPVSTLNGWNFLMRRMHVRIGLFVPLYIRYWGAGKCPTLSLGTGGEPSYCGIKLTFLPTFLLKYIIGDIADHGLIKYKDTKAKCRHLKNWPVKWLCGRCLSVLGPEPHTPPPSQVNSFRWRYFAFPSMSLIFPRFLLWHKVTLLHTFLLKYII